MSASTTSCTKESDPRVDTVLIKTVDTVRSYDTVIVNLVPDTAKPIVGLWIGPLYAHNEPSAGPLWYSFDILSDHTIYSHSEGADGNTYYSAGTWSLNGLAFSATITSTVPSTLGTVQIFTATYDSLAGRLNEGVWVNQNGTASGTFVLNRVN